MNFPEWPFRRRMILSGEVLVVRLVADPAVEHDVGFLWTIVANEGYRLREDVNTAIHEHLGPEFDIRSMSFARGSLEIFVVIGMVYYAVSRYKNFLESVDFLITQLKRVVGAFFEHRGQGPFSVRGSWTPGPGLVQPDARLALARKIHEGADFD